MNSIKKREIYLLLSTNLRYIIVKYLFLHLKWHLPIMSVNFLPKTKGFFLHDFTLIASVVGESVIDHGIGIRYRWLWHVLLRPDAGVSDDRLVCHHPISQPFTMSDGSKIQVRSRHVLRKDPTISYVEYLTNLSNESWTHARGRYLEADLLQDPSELRM